MTTKKCAFTAIAFGFFLITNIAPSIAQTKVLTDAQRTQVRAVSAELMDQGSTDFVLVEAIADGLLQPSAPYEFRYNKDSIVINDVRLLGSINEKYKLLMHNFITSKHKGENPDKYSLRVTSGGRDMNVDSILNPASSLRTQHFADQNRHAPRPDYKLLVVALKSDGIIGKEHVLKIDYTNAVLLINGSLLSPAADKKYKQLLNEKYEIGLGTSTSYVTIDVDAPDKD